jgi:hypothetical protein
MAILNVAKKVIGGKLLLDILRWEGFRPSKTSVNHNLGHVAIATAFADGAFRIRLFMSLFINY